MVREVSLKHDGSPCQTDDKTAKADESSSKIRIELEALADNAVGELPIGYLLAEVEQLAYKIAHVLDCPLDIVISTMFAVVSGAVGTKVKVFDGKYTNMLNINVCHVAPPGSNKTQPVSLLVKPLEQISKRKNVAYKEAPKPHVSNIGAVNAKHAYKY